MTQRRYWFSSFHEVSYSMVSGAGWTSLLYRHDGHIVTRLDAPREDFGEWPLPRAVHPLTSRGHAVPTFIDWSMEHLSEWGWHNRWMYGAYALRKAVDPTHAFCEQRYAGPTAEHRWCSRHFEQIQPDNETFEMDMRLSRRDLDDLVDGLRRYLGARFVTAVLDGTVYPEVEEDDSWW